MLRFRLIPPTGRAFSLPNLTSVYRSLACHRAGTHKAMLRAAAELRSGAPSATVGGWLIFPA